MKDYDAYLFDWDGTLARTLEAWMQTLRESFADYGLQLTDTEIFSTIGNFQHRITELGVSPQDLESFVATVLDASHSIIPHVPLYDDALAQLRMLRERGKKLALITSNWRKNVDVALASNGLTEMFDVVITGDDVTEHKPDPSGILSAIDQLGLPKQACVMLGDSDKDLGAAKNAGIDSILFYPPSHQLFYKLSELELHQPVRVITGWHELLA